MARPFVFRFTLAAATALSLIVVAGDVHAQRVTPPPAGGRDRAQLEQRFRQRFEELLKSRLALSDAQLQQMRDVNARLDDRRRELFLEERDIRRDMRDALRGGDDAATQGRVAELMDRALRVQRARLDLVESEQRELAAFLTPVQRAKYLGMQEQLRRRAEEMRRRTEGDTLDEGAAEAPPGAGGRQRRPFMRRPGA